MGIGQENGDSYGGGEVGDANDDGRNDSTGAANAGGNTGERGVSGVYESARAKNPSFSIGDLLGLIESGLSVASAIGAMTGLAAKDKAARDKTRSDLKEKGWSDSQIDDMESRARASTGVGASDSNGGEGFTGSDIIGNSAYDLLSSELDQINRLSGDETGASLADQVNGLFTGTDAPYSMQQLMKDFTGGVKSAADEYSGQNRDLAKMWDNFIGDFDGNYERMSKQYDDLNADYDANTRDYSSIYGRQQGLENQYDELLNGYYKRAASIPTMDLKLPGGMGGGSFSLAPKNWNNVYSQQAQTAGNILAGKGSALTDQRGTINSRLANTNSKKSAYDSKADLYQPWAQTKSTGITNRGVADQNLMNSRIAALKEQFTPFNTGYDIYDTDKQIAANANLQKERLDAAEPNGWDRWAPVAAAVMPSAIDLLKGLF